MSLRIGKGPGLRDGLDEKVERIVDSHVGDEIDLDLQFRHRLRENEARQEIAVGILLQIDEMIGRTDLQRMAQTLWSGNEARAAGGSLAAPA